VRVHPAIFCICVSFRTQGLHHYASSHQEWSVVRLLHAGVARLHTRALAPKPCMKQSMQSLRHMVLAVSCLLCGLLVANADNNIVGGYADEVCVPRQMGTRLQRTTF